MVGLPWRGCHRVTLVKCLVILIIFVVVTWQARVTLLGQVYALSRVSTTGKIRILQLSAALDDLPAVLAAIHDPSLANSLDGLGCSLKQFGGAGLGALERLAQHGSPEIRCRAVQLLANLDSGWRSRNLGRYLQDPLPEMRALTVGLMTHYWRNDWEEPLVTGLRDPSREVRHLICKSALLQHPCEKVRLALIQQVARDSDDAVRTAASSSIAILDRDDWSLRVKHAEGRANQIAAFCQ